MDEIDLHNLVDGITKLLDKHSATDVEAPYWFYNDFIDQLDESNPITEYDEAMSLCWACLHELMPAAEIGEHFGGGYTSEDDGCVHCERCGKLLDYTLTDYGVNSELEHYLDEANTGLDWESPDDCFHMVRVAHGLFDEQQKQSFVTAIKRSQHLPNELEGKLNP